MSIFKGDSIYKSGSGSGGGYKDGGALVDGDFIEVTNNSISTYDNTSRDPVNFYFEVSDGEIVNSVIEMTTAVNSTVNVYVVKNGFYYLLGNVGGDTVTAGNDYKINITGDSYAIENVSNSPTLEMVTIEGNVYGVLKVGSKYWLKENLKGGTDHSGMSYFSRSEVENNYMGTGWRIPTETELGNLITSYSYKDLLGSDHWYAGWGGTNASGMDIEAYGYWTGSFISRNNEDALFPYITTIGNTLNCMSFGKNSVTYGEGFQPGCSYTLRLVHDA